MILTAACTEYHSATHDTGCHSTGYHGNLGEHVGFKNSAHFLQGTGIVALTFPGQLKMR